ncbi:pectate lyase superfamily protein-domain-containing protein [Mycena metata]|uniref:Pectate lyase superfamily protein-domain-containing protein n=1 Tax=Mycena metata TaxID=1033252 RepID=A0AAD7IAW4_9AGAR|nr:pectate lyase superfamily protein-domain-containing protein [Mycena metata]
MLRSFWPAYLAALVYMPSFALAAGCAGITRTAAPTDPYWMNDAALTSLSKSAYSPGYKVFRNVKVDYHAVGDGIADDTVAINNAISGTMVGAEAKITPAIIFFPPGKYRVTAPIIPFYYTSLVGDYNSKPMIIADANFVGIAVIGELSVYQLDNSNKSNVQLDADPYIPGEVNPDGTGVNRWQNQNNFFRSVRNLVIDTTAMSPDAFGTGIHWQVGQATSLINLDFKSSAATGTKHQGIFMENGSGGFMSDLTFNGGAFGMWISNQQFTIRNVQITNTASAIYQEWNWGFTWQNIGFDLNTGGLTLATQSAGGVLIIDSKISTTGIGIRSADSAWRFHNVAFTGISTANIQSSSGTVVAANLNTGIGLEWFQGNVYLGTSKRYLQGSFTPVGSRPQTLTDITGTYLYRSRPQYETYSGNQFLTLMTSGLGAMEDGINDDTAAINTFLSTNSGCAILLIETGTYLVKNTIFVPAGTQVAGTLYAVIMGSGPNFGDQKNPRPVIQVGNPGDVGQVEMSDLIITTVGGSAGAIGIEWNLDAGSQGAAGLWDVHIRLGGAKGTNINAANCATSSINAAGCTSAFLGLHITPSGSGYFENVWVWNADHDLDDPNQTQINSFSGRGILVESATGPVWLVGTASEHHVIYQYAFNNAQNIYAGLIQTETAYFQPTPIPPAPFSTTPSYGDPSEAVAAAWGLVITNSFDMFVYGVGLYSFFQTYGQACVPNRNCQDSMVLVDQQSAAVYIYQLTTAGSTNMVSYPGNVSVALQADNIDGFASTLSFWGANGTGTGTGTGPGGGGGFGDFDFIPWNPNPHPSPGAVSETFVVSGGGTTVVPIPTETTITVGSQFVFLDPGATPVTALLPSTVSEINSVTPTWTFPIVPPTAGPVTFTAPISGSQTFSSVVPPPSSGVIVTVTGPGGAVWSFSGGPSGPSVVGTLPPSVGISGGTTPTPVLPIGWLGPWTDPVFPFLPNPNGHHDRICWGSYSNSKQWWHARRSWSLDIIPPPGASTITFTGPLTSTSTWIRIVPVPTQTDTPGVNLIGPPADKDRCNSGNIWTLFFNLIIDPCLPLDVGIIDGITPVRQGGLAHGRTPYRGPLLPRRLKYNDEVYE